MNPIEEFVYYTGRPEFSLRPILAIVAELNNYQNFIATEERKLSTYTELLSFIQNCGFPFETFLEVEVYTVLFYEVCFEDIGNLARRDNLEKGSFPAVRLKEEILGRIELLLTNVMNVLYRYRSGGENGVHLAIASLQREVDEYLQYYGYPSSPTTTSAQSEYPTPVRGASYPESKAFNENNNYSEALQYLPPAVTSNTTLAPSAPRASYQSRYLSSSQQPSQYPTAPTTHYNNNNNNNNNYNKNNNYNYNVPNQSNAHYSINNINNNYNNYNNYHGPPSAVNNNTRYNIPHHAADAQTQSHGQYHGQYHDQYHSQYNTPVRTHTAATAVYNNSNNSSNNHNNYQSSSYHHNNNNNNNNNNNHYHQTRPSPSPSQPMMLSASGYPIASTLHHTTNANAIPHHHHQQQHQQQQQQLMSLTNNYINPEKHPLMIKFLAHIRRQSMDIIFPMIHHDECMVCIYAALRYHHIPISHRILMHTITILRDTNTSPFFPTGNLKTLSKTKIRGVLSIFKKAKIVIDYNDNSTSNGNGTNGNSNSNSNMAMVQLSPSISSFHSIRYYHDLLLTSYCLEHHLQVTDMMWVDMIWSANSNSMNREEMIKKGQAYDLLADQIVQYLQDIHPNHSNDHRKEEEYGMDGYDHGYDHGCYDGEREREDISSIASSLSSANITTTNNTTNAIASGVNNDSYHHHYHYQQHPQSLLSSP